MAFKEGETDQIITGHGQKKTLGFQLKNKIIKENEESLAKIVRQYTGDWFTVVKCNQIQHEKRRNFDEVVYFGPKADLEKGGDAALLRQLSIIDRYNFDEQFVSFLVNEDPSCRTKFQLNDENRHILFLNGENTKTVAMTIGYTKNLSLQLLTSTLNIQMVKGSPRWGQRAYSSIFDFKQNAIIYMMDDLSSHENVVNDWRV